MLEKKYLKSKPVCKVTFTLAATSAESVHLVGDFNDWDEQATPLKRLRDGRFKTTLDLENERQYQFRYLVNGDEWHNDEEADAYVANPFGGEDSVVIT